ncbi:transposase [Halococcus sp. IIIV-5B]|uniref:transposase n=1 Tax=Halococcus sp. IIIV-5B TaxID=2321230 RepID=UPI001F2848B2|nr:transposase [Halococcus sp. IIIV-5B]
MEQLVRAFLLKALHGCEHESALAEYLDRYSSVRKHLGFESVPDQSTLWRTWHRRFVPELRETIETAARSILIQADRADVPVPRQPPERSSPREQSKSEAPTQQERLDHAEEITEQVSEFVHPSFPRNCSPRHR